MKATAYAKIGYTGQEVYRFELEWKGNAPAASEIDVQAPFKSASKTAYVKSIRGVTYGDILDVKAENGVLTIEVEPFTTRKGFALSVAGQMIPFEDIKIITEMEDEFASGKYENVLYRLYSPKSEGKHPLILFLHGGGNGGTAEGRDNWLHIKVDYGCMNFPKKFPDAFVLAPQAIEKPFGKGGPINPGKQSFHVSLEDNDFGWNRTYLSKICEIIRKLIAEGKVDERRVYVTGMSMGGAGTIKMMSVGAGLFAACVPVCPTMNEETFNILRTMKAPVWVASSYVDHTIYRHKYLVDAVMQLKDEGNKNAHLTLYSPEELEKYDISIDPAMTYEQKFSENHMSWVPTYCDEYGIMSWMMNQVKEY